MIVAQMTKKEAIRRSENLALETGHKRNYYVKRALVEFLDCNEHLLGKADAYERFLDPRRSLFPPEQVSAGLVPRSSPAGAQPCGSGTASVASSRLQPLLLQYD